jgi:hypothetical protein
MNAPASTPRLRRTWPDDENCFNCCNRHGSVALDVFVQNTTEPELACPSCADEIVREGMGRLQ